MKRRDAPIVGADVGDQARLRPRPPARDIDEFLEFLDSLEVLFGRIERPRQPTTGEHFLL